MKLFDLHCDTVTECFSRNESLKSNSLNISLDKAKKIEKWCQVFAIWMPDEYRKEEAEIYYRSVLEKFREEIKLNEGKIKSCTKKEDIKKALYDRKCAAILAVEGGSILNGKIENLEKIFNDGVRLMTLTWNGKNEIGNGCYSDDKSGLTTFGKQVVKKMNELSMTIDVSHLNENGFYDVAKISDSPFIASHSDCFSVNNHVRSLTDEQIRIIVERKGLVGINFYNEFLGKNYDCFDAVYRHLYHLLSLGGEDSVAIGTDFDGCDISDELNGIEKMPALFDYLNDKFCNEKLVNKIFFENAYNFFNSDKINL